VHGHLDDERHHQTAEFPHHPLRSFPLAVPSPRWLGEGTRVRCGSRAREVCLRVRADGRLGASSQGD
jgi:hypothetical protein